MEVGLDSTVFPLFFISLLMRTSEIARISASSTTNPGNINASAKSVATAATMINIASPTISVSIRAVKSPFLNAIPRRAMNPVNNPTIIAGL